MRSGRLDYYESFFSKLFAVKYLIELAIGFQLVYYRLYKDLFNEHLAAFHIKEQLIIQILVRVSKIIDQKSRVVSRKD